ncbi:MAG: chloride channel protein [Acidobacteria bacterium]|nr:chloride channel protein [Acidobacteriota bacterium]
MTETTRGRIGRWWGGLLQRHEDHVSLAVVLVTGGLVGLTVVAFIVLTEKLANRLFQPGGPALARVLIPIGGSILAGALLARWFSEARGSGVPQTKAALFAHDGVITLRTVIGKFFLTSFTLASGIPLGREGPAVQVGGGIASVIARALGLGRERVKALIPAGVSAAVAAAFNTPLAGVLFALEELMGNLNAPVLGSVVLSSAASWMVLRLVLGNEPLFHLPAWELVHPAEFAVYAVLGLVGGLFSVVFVRLVLWVRARFLAMPKGSRWIQPAAGGLLVGLLGWAVPEVLGVGYGHVGNALNNGMPFRLMALLLVLKLFAVGLCYGSGSAGGIFGPSLFMGAMLGGTVGSIAHSLLPADTAPAGAYALVGMGTLFAGIIRAPMTSVIIIFEVTRDYTIIVPLMTSNLISFFVSRRLQRQPIYEALSMQDGVHLPGAEVKEQAEKRRCVGDVMRDSSESLPAVLTVKEAAQRLRRSRQEALPVAGDHGLLGLAGIWELDRLLAGGRESEKLADVLDPSSIPHVHPDQTLELALERMGKAECHFLPVVSRADAHELRGIITLNDILAAYGLQPRRPNVQREPNEIPGKSSVETVDGPPLSDDVP